MALGTAMLLAVIGLSVVAESRLGLRSSVGDADAREAGILAFSATEYGMAQLAAQTIADVPTWRDTIVSGQMQPGVSLGRGTMQWMLEDPDGDLSDDDSDPLTLYGIGIVNESRRVYRVQLEPEGAPLDCLASAVHAGGQFLVNNASDSIVASGAPVTSNGNAASSGTIDGDLETAGSFNNQGTITGTVTEGAQPKQMPDSQYVFEFYVKNGTRIEVTDLDTCPSGHPCIRNAVLSPRSNPFGTDLNRRGIYVIDCMGNNLEIQNARIVGTLVLMNAGVNSVIQNSNRWEPAVPNYPVLMVDGGVGELSVSNAPLDEAALSVNFNPSGTPYNGIEDADTIDTYPSEILGLVYVNGTITIRDVAAASTIIARGSIATGGSVAGTATINYKATSYRNPPPGFRAGGHVVPVAGTWDRAALP